MRNKSNSIYQKVGQIFQEIIPTYSDLTLLRDHACGCKQHLPLLCIPKKGRENEFCNVDLLVLKAGKIKTIVETKESNVKPTQVCCKFLTAALSKYFIHEPKGNMPAEMAEDIVFIQIVDTSKLVEEKLPNSSNGKPLKNR